MIYSSVDGRKWSEPTYIDAALDDVAFGNGQWLAVGDTRSWTSADGETWTEQAPFAFDLPDTYAGSVAFGDGHFLMNVSNCGASRCSAYQGWKSPDGVSWTQEPVDVEAVPQYGGYLAFSSTFGTVGTASGGIPPGGSMANESFVPAAALLQDGSWRSVAMQPADLFVSGLTGTGKGWIAVGGRGMGSDTDGVWTSPDLSSWTRIATIDTRLADIAVVGPAGGDSRGAGGTGGTRAHR